MSDAVHLGMPGLTEPGALPVEYLTISHDRVYRIAMVNAGLACCSIEYVSALEQWGETSMATDLTADQSALPGSQTDLSVLVVSGTCTTKIAPLVTSIYEAMPEGTKVVSFGACTASGGPYWDSYSVVKGIAELIPVDIFVPGCPPRPEALLHGLSQLVDQSLVAP
jgi:NADH-quinone oxidoreductase subunit B